MEQEGQGRKKRYRHMVCDVCGHEWTSYGYGERIICPACVKRANGTAMGKAAGNAEHMEKMRAAKKAKQEQRKLEVIEESPTKLEEQEEKQKRVGGSFWSNFLNKEVF